MSADRVEAHYEVEGLTEAIRRALVAAGKRLDALTVDDLAPVDAFHIRGRQATMELAAAAELAPGTRVLDIGSGIGGTARYLAAAHGCDVTGVDLTAAFCRTATDLTNMVGLGDRVRFRQGSALELPFEDGSFDVAWTEHAQMNIGDKRRFYREAARVLRPGGQLVFHDIFQGPGGPPHFPEPWADEPALSFLCPPEEARAILEELGLELREWRDVSEASRAFFETVLARPALPTLGLHLVIRGDIREKLGNLLRSLAERRVTVIEAIARKPA